MVIIWVGCGSVAILHPMLGDGIVGGRKYGVSRFLLRLRLLFGGHFIIIC